VSIQHWAGWSRHGADPYAWLRDWVQQHPASGGALLAVADGSDRHGRLLFIASHGQLCRTLARSPWASDDAPVISDATFENGIELGLNAQLQLVSEPRAQWLPPQGSHLRVLPLVQQGGIAFWLFLTANEEPLHGVDLVDFNLRAALGLGSSRLRFAEELQQRGSAAITALAEVQRLLQPDQPLIRGLDYALHWQPAETAAGDYYDLMSLTHVFGSDYDATLGDVWGVMVGDVSGHGAAAAMEAVQFDAILRTYKAGQDEGPAGALTYANRHFLSRRSRQRFMTVLAAGFRPDLGELRYANAGHLPLLHRRGNRLEVHDEGGMPLGVLRDTVYRNQQLSVRAGDLLLLYTDGLVEARDSRGEQFGQERLLQIVERGPARPQELLSAVLEALFRHQGGPIGRDDQTLVVLGVQAGAVG
jgi:sigma-B regulation protein RsbU (phosphoserine phosphatase)